MLQTPGRRARRPCGQDLRPGPGSARTVCLPWRRADQGPAVFRGILFFFFPLMLQRFFVLRGAVSCWNSFHNKLKNPAVALEAAVEAEGSCVLSRMGGGSSAAKVGSVSNTVPAGLGVGGGIRSRVAGARPSEETEGRLDSQVPRTRG